MRGKGCWCSWCQKEAAFDGLGIPTNFRPGSGYTPEHPRSIKNYIDLFLYFFL